jgi:hypothetical protein
MLEREEKRKEKERRSPRSMHMCSHVSRHAWLQTPCICTYALDVEVSRALIKDEVIINEVGVINIRLGVSLALNVK